MSERGPKRKLPGGLLVIEKSGTVADAPDFWMEALDLEIGDPIFDLFDLERRAHLEITRIFAKANGSREYHVVAHRDDGQPKNFRYWDVSPGGGMIAFFVVDDTSLEINHEWRIRRLRRNVVADMQDYLSDNVRSRLASLRALTEVLRDRPDDVEEAAERILVAVDSLHESIQALGEDLGDGVSSDEKLPVRATELGPLVSSWSDKMVNVVCDLDDEIDPAAFVSPRVIEDILQPVVANAIESRPNSGTVEVSIESFGDKLCFEVVDDGRGMTRHELGRAEDPFFTTKRGHAGLGLSTARDALRLVGGYWNYSSSRRRGTRVRVVVPAMHMEGVMSEVYEEA